LLSTGHSHVPVSVVGRVCC